MAAPTPPHPPVSPDSGPTDPNLPKLPAGWIAQWDNSYVAKTPDRAILPRYRAHACPATGY
ncbi:hypothetical protein M3J09_000100 [Ascochyta lentis]